MRARLAFAGAVLALSFPASAAAADSVITMPGKYFQPARVTAVAGDTLIFKNADLVAHDVRVPAGPFDSGPLGRLAAWSQTFAAPGDYEFLCTLHPFMSGTVQVVPATLAAAPYSLLAGEQLTLAGRAPAGTATVELLRGDEPLGTVAPAADGSFSFTTRAVEGASYRVRTPLGDSPAVTPDVTAAIDVHLMARGRSLQVHTTPAADGLVATLELYARWRYRWGAHARKQIGTDGMVRFTRPARRTYARIALRRAKGGPVLVHSGTIKLWNGRPAQDPDAITPPATGHPGGHGHGG